MVEPKTTNGLISISSSGGNFTFSELIKFASEIQVPNIPKEVKKLDLDLLSLAVTNVSVVSNAKENTIEEISCTFRNKETLQIIKYIFAKNGIKTVEKSIGLFFHFLYIYDIGKLSPKAQDFLHRFINNPSMFLTEEDINFERKKLLATYLKQIKNKMAVKNR